MTNALKHARPERIDIELTFAEATVDLLVRDDGAGMTAVQPPATRSSGCAAFGSASTSSEACCGSTRSPRGRAPAWRSPCPFDPIAGEAHEPSASRMLVDDHYLVRMGLTSVLSLETDITVCAEASSAEQAIELFASHRPDVTLMDARLPGLSGTEATAALRRHHPDARIVMLSTYGGDEDIYSALQAGAMAYLLKSVQREELLLAIRKAAIGKRHVPPELAERLAERLTRSQLSSRELDVLRLLVGGMRNRQIAFALDIAEGHRQTSRQQRAGEARCRGQHGSRYRGPAARHRAAQGLTSVSPGTRGWAPRTGRCSGRPAACRSPRRRTSAPASPRTRRPRSSGSSGRSRCRRALRAPAAGSGRRAAPPRTAPPITM